jgi:hypothetical protein
VAAAVALRVSLTRRQSDTLSQNVTSSRERAAGIRLEKRLLSDSWDTVRAGVARVRLDERPVAGRRGRRAAGASPSTCRSCARTARSMRLSARCRTRSLPAISAATVFAQGGVRAVHNFRGVPSSE